MGHTHIQKAEVCLKVFEMLICKVGSTELLTNYCELNFGAGFIDFIISTHHKESGKQSLGGLCKSPITHRELLNAHWGTMSPINLNPQQEVQANDLWKVQMSALQHIFSKSGSGKDSKGIFHKTKQTLDLFDMSKRRKTYSWTPYQA